MDTLAEIKQAFFQECDEQLVELEAGLLAVEGGERDPELVNAAFRAVHSVKGGAGAFNLVDLVRFAHAFENVMDLVRVGRLEPAPALVRLLLKATDVLADLLRAARADAPHDAARAEAVTAELAAACAGPAPPPSASDPMPDARAAFAPIPVDLDAFGDLGAAHDPGPRGAERFRISFRPRAELYAKGNDATVLMRELARLGELDVRCDLGALPLLDALDPEAAYLGWTATLDTAAGEDAVRDVFDFAEWDSELAITRLDAPAPAGGPADREPPAPPAFVPIPVTDLPDLGELPAAAPTPAGRGAAAVTIRVDLNRVDRLIDLVGELVINQAMLAERVAEAGLARVSQVAVGLDELEQLTREIQDSVMAIRAQPVRSVFQRMPRLVREVASQVGKSVRLVVQGENTEVDKTVVERLIDPLTHMIRNAVDHGLERPEARRAAGKPEEGQVALSAAHRSGRIVIEVADDGAGIDRPRVRATAVEKGLIPADARLTDDETDNLIFLPGFSTAATVSDISGRGVGMDVVRRSIQALGGRISISSRPGLGSTFVMSLPLTLAVLDGMVVSLAGHTLVVPLPSIVEILLPKATAVHGFGDGARVIGVRDSFVPLVDVGAVMGLRGRLGDAHSGVALLVEVEGGNRAALLVDAIQGQRQVVIKSLEANYGHVPGIAAATILGDGRVALILDVDAVAAPGARAALPELARAG